MDGINSVNQNKEYAISNMKTWYKFKSRNHVMASISPIVKEQLLYYNPGMESLLGLK